MSASQSPPLGVITHPEIWSPSPGGSLLSGLVRERLRQIADHSGSTQIFREPATRPLQADKNLRLFNTSAALKMAAAEVSMHLPADWRRKLFDKIDDLHEPEDWDDADRMADVTSFRTFLRTVLRLGAMKKMSIGISDDGHILAGWRRGKDSLSLAFLPGDRIRWSIVEHVEGNTDSAAGTTTLERLPQVLKPYNPEVWFGYADDVSAA